MRGAFQPWMMTVVAGVVMVAQSTGVAAVPGMEDLSACRLPNGMVILPTAGSEGAKGRGDLLKLASGTLSTVTVVDGGHALTPDQILEKLRTSQQGDLQYFKDAGGTFWAVSGRVADLGTRYLSEAAAMTLTRPMSIPATSRGPAGMHPGLAEGHVYLVQGTDEKYALVRVLEMTEEGIALQYVHQPSGAIEFQVPEGDRLPYQRSAAVAAAAARISAATKPAEAAATPPGAVETPPTSAAAAGPNGLIARPGVAGVGGPASPGAVMGVAPAASMPPTPAPTAPQPMVPGTPLVPTAPKGLGPRDIVEPGRIVLRDAQAPATGLAPASGIDPAVEGNLRQRDQMIQMRMAIVSQPARAPADVDRKAQAANELAALRADQSADLLVTQITFLNVRSSAREFSPEVLHPCFAALKKLGKPASLAALKGLRDLDVDVPGEGIDSPWYRAGLLAQVIRAVEGEEVAQFMLKTEMEKQTEAKQRALFEHLLGKN